MPSIAEIGRVVRNCAAMMNGGDTPKRLAEALPKISQLRKRLAEIERDIAEHSKRFSRHTAEKKAQSEASGLFKDECEYILAQVIENWHKEHAVSPAQRARLIYGVNPIGQTAKDEAFANFASEVPGWREPLETALKAKTQIAKQALMETEATVRDWLSGFDDEDIENDPRLKQAKREVTQWQGLEARFADGKDLAAWKLALDALFSE
jgi:hypothetical protein